MVKRKVLVELVQTYNPLEDFNLKTDYPVLLSEKNLYMQDRFTLHLKSDNLIISPERIKGFSITEKNNNRLIFIKSNLYIEEWLDDFKKMNFVKIYFFDKNGNIISFVDFDLEFIGYNNNCDYLNHDILTPIFNYKIF